MPYVTQVGKESINYQYSITIFIALQVALFGIHYIDIKLNWSIQFTPTSQIQFTSYRYLKNNIKVNFKIPPKLVT